LQDDTEQRAQPARVRRAQRALLDGQAASLAEQVRTVFCEPTRAQIVRALSAGPLPVGDLAGVVGRGRTTVSKHLRVLRDLMVVLATRQGRTVYYALTAEPVTLASIKALNAVAEVAA
jgi:DNA-binding transcriptional ArsR family regulator